jgi:hypothetical protein
MYKHITIPATLFLILFSILVTTSSAKANYCTDGNFDPYNCIYQKLSDNGTINSLIPPGWQLDTSKGINGFTMNPTNWKSTNAVLTDTMQSPHLLTSTKLTGYGCTKNNATKFSGQSSLALEQSQSISDQQTINESYGVTFNLHTDSNFGATQVTTDTDLNYQVDTTKSNVTVSGSTTSTSNVINVNEVVNIECGGKRVSKDAYNGPYYFNFSQNADQIQITDTSGNTDINGYYDLYPETELSTFTVAFKQDVWVQDVNGMGVNMIAAGGQQCNFGVGNVVNYQAYSANQCGGFDWKNMKSYWFSNPRGNWEGCYTGSYYTNYKKNNSWKTIPYAINATPVPGDMDTNMGFVLTNNCYKAQTNYQSINYNLKQYLAYQAIDPTNFKSNYNDEKNTQYHRVDFIYNATTYNNVQSQIDMTAYFIFNPSTPSYSLDSILGACKKLVKNWNDSCGRNNLQNIVIDIGDDEYVTQFNTFLTDNEKSGEPLICKNDKGKYYIADPGVSCP